jgi:predicted anti-sigma-YlaC factor YlaD
MSTSGVNFYHGQGLQTAEVEIPSSFRAKKSNGVLRVRTVTQILFAISLFGCSLKKRAVDTFVDVLGEAERVYLSEDDPELVGSALPFNLKTIETLLVSSPDNRSLLLSAAKSFSLYAYGYVEPRAWELSPASHEELEESERIRKRAAKLYRRGYSYGVRGLEVEHPGIESRLKKTPEAAARDIEISDVPLAVWTAAALGGAIGLSKDDPESTADVAVIGALLERALLLDEDFEEGTTHELLMAYEASRVGGSRDKALMHYERALSLGTAKRPSIWLGWAERVSVIEQNRSEFDRLIEQSLAFEVEAHPENRLLNLLAQRRAQWLKANAVELFLEGLEGPDGPGWSGRELK